MAQISLKRGEDYETVHFDGDELQLYVDDSQYDSFVESLIYSDTE